MIRAALPAAVLWDLDGTLVDTEPLWRRAEAGLVAQYGGQWTYEDGLQLVGTALPDYAQVLREHGVRLSVDEILDDMVVRVLEGQAGGPPWQPGARELVEALRRAGVPQALVTSSYRSLTVPVVEATGAFAVVVPGDEVAGAKPDPEPYLTAAARLGVDVTRCVVVEDSSKGVAAGLAAGARVLLVESPADVPEDPRLSRTDSLRLVGLDHLARIAAGEVLELRGDPV
jgi:beta-phosphoglucomutase-like phosphatase (HAD superfamily)